MTAQKAASSQAATVPAAAAAAAAAVAVAVAAEAGVDPVRAEQLTQAVAEQVRSLIAMTFLCV